ncbi:imelysin family protein [Vibrio hippocampi]|uniref:Imelysin-like domain-containing protein n=1 Tax=Vibrio hippocampi TaxID=654686 RepID=A0ABM8ZG34_9VIBR|nr:imelysin family protein [Vibrio hippocampi]CAH0525600.1 hypothetical protein VHP8226_01128 [Vibrio hippocampi]
MKHFVIGLFYLACLGNAFAETSVRHPSDAVYQLQYQSAQSLNERFVDLSQSVWQFCQHDTEISEVKLAWQQGTNAWMRLQGQERGPEVALEQSWNIQFWPDKKNTTGRKMLLAVKTDEWQVDQLQQQSVTVQGLGAMEWLLFDSQASMSQGSRATCSLAVAISEALVNRSQLIASAWSSNPWLPLNQQAWHGEYLALLSNQLDYSMKKLSRPLAKMGHPKPYFSESWRAKTSMAQLKVNVEALKALYFAKGHGLDNVLREYGNVELADSISKQFDLLLSTWSSQASLFDLLQTKSGYTEVLSQYNKLEYLRYLLSEQAAIQLGVVVGFNATDGD